jgi:hypothetical protein
VLRLCQYPAAVRPAINAARCVLSLKVGRDPRVMEAAPSVHGTNITPFVIEPDDQPEKYRV